MFATKQEVREALMQQQADSLAELEIVLELLREAGVVTEEQIEAKITGSSFGKRKAKFLAMIDQGMKDQESRQDNE